MSAIEVARVKVVDNSLVDQDGNPFAIIREAKAEQIGLHTWTVTALSAPHREVGGTSRHVAIDAFTKRFVRHRL